MVIKIKYDQDRKYVKGSTYIEVHMLSRNHITYYIQPVNLNLGSVGIIKMQQKVHVYRKKRV